ncbi:hypothetical protein BJ138DRAFT_1057479 [Hygrophoropsis aurantiaca]|uniref:Uncharacterized protein n=1 Tax=Hygrophoropsis aurantiaca TaxID=72124 RepID=A0ACB8AMH3_9AGAM|nr:hypothetical protein BJ138DRAFT_1057479 [Hygrophoropsis aurantiaca]
MSEKKMALPAFLKVLTSNGVPVPKAMAVASKIYKDFNTPAHLVQLTDAKLKVSGVDDKETRKFVLAAVRKAGYTPATQRKAIQADTASTSSEPSSSNPPSTVQVITTPTKKKRKRNDDLKNDLLPDALDEAASYGSLEFNEVMNEEVLKTKSTFVNRAPLMAAWATVVAERLGFEREEALSIASVYTEMNAISKGVAIGVYSSDKTKETSSIPGAVQPYVDLMGRRPLYQTQTSQWRALANNSPALPSTSFSYISRAFRQTTAYILGALRLLAQSYTPQELNAKGFGLYAEFRPVVDGWGQRGDVRCDRILSLRGKGLSKGMDSSSTDSVVAFGESSTIDEMAHGQTFPNNANEPELKKARTLTLEEYEATLDGDSTFDDVDLDLPVLP